MLSVAIMAHPKREAFIPELQAKLDRPAEVVWDQKNDRWDTGRRALLSYDPNATHHLVLQDDAVIPHDLIAGVEQALTRTPGDVPLCLYVGKVRPYRELVDEYTRQADHASFLVMHELNWGVGIVFPTKLIDDMVAWCDGQKIPNYDSRLSRWLEAEGISTWYPWPSLVDHRESPSLIPGRGHAGRVARRFVGADASALDIDWGGEVITIPHPIPDRFHRPGVPMLFICEKHDNYYVPNVRVQFEGGYAEVSNRSAISYLNGAFMRRRGIRPATPDEIEAYTARLPVAEEQGQTAVPESPASEQPEGEHPAQTPEPPSEEGALTVVVPEGTAAEVLDWVDGDAGRAKAALDAEQARDKPRSTLVTKLETLTKTE